MGWQDTLKEKARDHIITVLFGLITLLLLAIWKAVPGKVWDRVSEATPKRVLWALIGLELIAIGLLTAFALDDRRKGKQATPSSGESKHMIAFGCLWDNSLNPLCPADKTLMYVAIHYKEERYETLRCPKCKVRIPLRDDEYGTITLAGARELLREKLETSHEQDPASLK
jgi:hypothetical protein